MELEQVAKVGNHVTVEVCEQLMERFGPGKAYNCVIGTVATAMLFHSYRIHAHQSRKNGVEVLQAILEDVARNIKDINGDDIKFTVVAS